MRSVLPWNFNQNKKVVGGQEGEGSCLVFTVKMVIPMSGRQQRTKHSAGQGMETFFFFFFKRSVLGGLEVLACSPDSTGRPVFVGGCGEKMDRYSQTLIAVSLALLLLQFPFLLYNKARNCPN